MKERVWDEVAFLVDRQISALARLRGVLRDDPYLVRVSVRIPCWNRCSGSLTSWIVAEGCRSAWVDGGACIRGW